MKKLFVAVLFASFAAGCAGPNLCERKENFLANHCAGTDVSYSSDAYCQEKIGKCSPAHLKQLEGYVSCLEAANLCSLEVMGQCAQAHPGGVNLICS